MIGEEPPPLPFPSLPKLKGPAKDILDAQRNPSSPGVDFKHFQPSSTESEKKVKKVNKNSCDICKKKKIRCDNNAPPDEVCKRGTSCACRHHIFTPTTTDDHSMDANIKYKKSPSADFYESKPLPLLDIIPSTTVFRKPGLLSSGHFTGETSFCGYMAPESQPQVIIEEDTFPTIDPIPAQPPYITVEDQLYLIDVYYQNVNPYFPILNKQEVLNQRELVMSKNGFTYLSPLFFYALFARAAHVVVDRKFTQYKHQTFHDLGVDCITYASALVNCYRDKPRVSTVLSLIIMANHLEQTKLPENLTRSWLWAGEAFRLALDLGIHRSLISESNNQFGQLCIRSFWLAYITDCTFSMTYGRPSATEEKVLDVTLPRRISSDDDTTAEWIEGLNSLISLSKIANRVIKFNYCPPPPFKIQEPVKRHNAFLASVDSWLTDVMQPNNEPDSPAPNPANVIYEESTTSKRLNFQKKIFLYTNLILLHRPYVNDFVQSRNSTRPSYDICAFAAIIITDIVRKLDTNELIYHSKSPITAYALVMALRIHIMNASTNSSLDKFNSERNYTQCLEVLDKLPQCQIRNSLLYTALTDLRGQFNNRFALAQEREREIQSQIADNQTEQLTMTKAEAILGPCSFESKRKERPNSNSDSSVVSSTESSTSNTINGLSVKQYQPPSQSGRKRKKGNPADSAQQNNATTKRKSKNAPFQKAHVHVFPTASTTAAATATTATTITTTTTNHTNNNINSTVTTATFTAAGQQQSHQNQGRSTCHNFDTQHQDFSQLQQNALQSIFSSTEPHAIPSHMFHEQGSFLNSQQQPQQQSYDNSYPITQLFPPSPQTYTPSNTNSINNDQLPQIDYRAIQAQGLDYLNDPNLMYGTTLVDEDFNFNYLDMGNEYFGGSEAMAPTSYHEMTPPTWNVKNENDTGVSITPEINGYTPPGDPSAASY